MKKTITFTQTYTIDLTEDQINKIKQLHEQGSHASSIVFIKSISPWFDLAMANALRKEICFASGNQDVTHIPLGDPRGI